LAGYTPTVSIIISVRNEEAAIARTVETCFKTDYPSELREVIVVDDIHQKMGLGGQALGLHDDALALPKDAMRGATRVGALLRSGRGRLDIAPGPNHGDRGAHAHRGTDLDRPRMLVENSAHHGQPQPGPLLLGGIKGLKNMGHILLGDAGPVVTHGHGRHRLGAFPKHMDDAAIRHGLAGVLDQVKQAMTQT